MNSANPELFIGVTSWNSELFLAHCLRAIASTTQAIRTQVTVLDNCSTDRSAGIAREMGADLVVEACSQPVALNRLLSLSRAPYSLLIHADVVLLSPNWFALCKAKISDSVVLVSPEDIGCGPYTRPFGIGLPESSFMLFDTAAARRTRVRLWPRWHRIPMPWREMDFYGPHITHRLPQRLRAKGYDWQPMRVHISDQLETPIYEPPFAPRHWSDELGSLRYGLGNFYSLDGEITHYHNWYDRVQRDVAPDSTATTSANGEGFPLAFVMRYTRDFLRDLSAGQLVVPSAAAPQRAPKAL